MTNKDKPTEDQLRKDPDWSCPHCKTVNLAIREQAKREQKEADKRVLTEHIKRQSLSFTQWSRGRIDGLVEARNVIDAAWAKQHPEKGR